MIRVIAAAVLPASCTHHGRVFLDLSVTTQKTWDDELDEGNISTGVTISEALDQYEMICNGMELGGVLAGSYTRRRDGYYHERGRAR